MIEKTAKLLGQAKIIYGFITICLIGMYNAITWAGDQRYVTLANYEVSNVRMQIRNLNNKIGELKIKLQYAENQRAKDMLKSLIINAETQIKNLKGE